MLILDTTVDGIVADVPFLAVQSGDGAWSTIATSDGHVEIELDDDRYGVVVVCPGTDPESRVRIRQATFSESDRQVIRCFTSAPTPTLSGTVTGFERDAMGTVFVSGGAWSQIVDFRSPDYGIEMRELGARRQACLVARANTSRDPTHVNVERDLDLDESATLDFDVGGAPVAFTPHALTVLGAEKSGGFLVSSSLLLDGGLGCVLGTEDDHLITLDEFDLREAELYAVSALTMEDNGSMNRSHAVYFTQGEAMELTLPDAGPGPTVESQPAGEHLLVSFESPPSDWAQLRTFSVAQGDGVHVWDWRADVSTGWLGSGSTHYTMPDLSGVGGFDPAWTLQRDVDVNWGEQIRASSAGYALALGDTVLGTDELPAERTAGVTTDTVTRRGQL